MRFEWDENKNRINYRKHRVLFETAVLVFDDPTLVMLQDREVDGEERWQTMGRVGGLLLLMVAHTVDEKEGDEIVRIISARKATAHERRGYEGNRYEGSRR